MAGTQVSRRTLLAGIAATPLIRSARAADAWPTRPVQVMVPYPPAGGADTTARILYNKVGNLLGQQFVIENRGGAGGTIGEALVAKAAPDGYTMLMATVSTNAINPALYRHLPYDSETAFDPVGRIGVTPTILMANLSLPVTDVKSLIALIRNNPGKYSYGSSGVGSSCI